MTNISRATAVIDNALGITLTNAKLLQVANAFVIARSDLIPIDNSDPLNPRPITNLTNEDKAAIVLEAVKQLFVGTVGGVAARQAEEDEEVARKITIQAAKDLALSNLT